MKAHLASVVQASHSPLPKPDDAGHHGEAEDNTLEQGEHAHRVHSLTKPQIQSKKHD